MLYANEPLIGDHNYTQFIGDGKTVVHDGRTYFTSRMPRKSAYGAAGIPTFEAAGFVEHELNQIYDDALHLQETETRISDLITWPELDQNGFNYCWVWAVTEMGEIVLVKMGLPHVSLSPTSVGGPITGYRNVGGFGQDAYDFGMQYGWATAENWPLNKIGNSSFETEAVKADRLKHKIIGGCDVKTNSLGQLWTLLTAGIPVGMGLPWWSHEVKGCDVIVDPAFRNDPNRGKKGIIGTRGRNQWKNYGAKNKHGVTGFFAMTPSKSQGDYVAITQMTSYAA
jgi:hypothetical protein